MATVYKWTPFGVALDITATGSGVTRKSATQFTVNISVSWVTYYSGAQTNYGMKASSGGITHTISAFNGTKRSSGSGSFTGTYSISGNGSATKTITVTFNNFNTDNDDSASKSVTFNVSVPAWTSYTVSYNANGGAGAPSKQTKWKDQTLVLSSIKPTRTGYSFLGWSTSSTATSASYAAGANYTTNSGTTLYAVWKANTYTISYNANGGVGAPASQTKTYGVTLTLSNTKPTRTNYNFKGWGTSASSTTVAYSAGASYTANVATTLYAIWELAYTKPRIANLSVIRCESDGTASDQGSYAKVIFGWSTDVDVSQVLVIWTDSDGVEDSAQITASGRSGNINAILGDGELSSEKMYSVVVRVEDLVDYSHVTSSIPSAKFAIDALAGGEGVSFGKAAELSGYADFGFNALFRGNVRGSAFGLKVLPQIGENEDFNSYLVPGVYGVASHAIAGTIANNPAGQMAGRLVVCTSTGGDTLVHGWTYIQQWYICMSVDKGMYVRSITRSPNEAPVFNPWYKYTPTKA